MHAFPFYPGSLNRANRVRVGNHARLAGRRTGSAALLCAVLIGLTVGAASLSAARRVYESRQSLEQTVAAMMEQMSEAGLKISIRKVYDLKADGKQGFVLYLAPRNSLCEITFRGDPGNANRSVVSVFTEDARDAGVFHDFFTGRMGLKEVGVNEDFDDSNPWPVPVR